MIMNYLNLLSPVHQGKPRFMALASTVLGQAVDLLSLYREGLPEAFTLETAEGFFLDTLGQLCGIPRPTPGMSDTDYRAYLRAWIQLHHWDGTNKTLGSLLDAAFPESDARLTDNLDGTATASISGSIPFELKDVFPCPAGIKLVEGE